MSARRAAVVAVALGCACAGGPALASVAGRAPRTGSPTVTAVTGTAAINDATLTSPQTIPHTTTTATGTTTTATGTATATGTTTTPAGTTTTGTTTQPKTAPVPKLAVCLKVERTVLAHALDVKASAVRETQRVGSNGMPQCNLLVHRAHTEAGPHTRAVVVINVDNGAQAAWRLMRKIVEADQIFGPPPPGWKPPIGLNGLGPYAGWYPNLDQMMINNVTRSYILTVSIIWYRAKTKEMISLARAAVLPYRRVRRFARYSGPLRVGARH